MSVSTQVDHAWFDGRLVGCRVLCINMETDRALLPGDEVIFPQKNLLRAHKLKESLREEPHSKKAVNA